LYGAGPGTAESLAASGAPTAPVSIGIGIPRGTFQSSFSNAEFTFDAPVVEEGKIRVYGRSIKGRAMVALIGPADNLSQATLMLFEPTNRRFTDLHTIFYVLFTELAFPDVAERGVMNRWTQENRFDIARGLLGGGNVRTMIGSRETMAGVGTFDGVTYLAFSVKND